jgi:hypothetical protein
MSKKESVDAASMHPIVHTPGPWEYVASVAMVRAMDDEMTVCELKGWGYLTAKHNVAKATDEMDRNGRLIAEAPEMFQVIQRMSEPGEIGESELKMLVEECRRIVQKVV